LDTLTHIAVGGCIGEMIAGRHLGRKALWFGAALQSLPDIDFVASFWLDPVSDLLAHRGFTHSFLFAAMAAPLLAYFAWRAHPRIGIPLNRWTWFFSIEIVIHLFLDAFNAYGTGWFEPFSHARISFNALFVADPFFSIFPIIAFVALLFTHKTHYTRKWWIAISMTVMIVYLSMSVVNKLIVDHRVQRFAQAQGINYRRHFTTPTPMNTLLWFAVMETDSGFYLGYRSLFDTKPDMTFKYFPRNPAMLEPFKNTRDVIKLRRFSQGFYTVEQWSDTLVFNDLRFGQMIGWEDISARFVFHYFLNIPEGNPLVVQRGRFTGWNRKAVRSLVNRIKGE
jgi:inner membrane protein